MLFRLILNNTKQKIESKTGDQITVAGMSVPVENVKIGDAVPGGTVTNIATFEGDNW